MSFWRLLKTDDIPDGQRPYFYFAVVKDGEEVRVLVGAIIYFSNGFEVRSHDDRGFGSYCRPMGDRWMVKVGIRRRKTNYGKRKSVVGLVLPLPFKPDSWTRKSFFVPLYKVRDGKAVVISV